MHPEQVSKQRPRIIAIDRDATTRTLLANELDDRYGRHYNNIVIVASSDEAARTSATSHMPTWPSSSPIVLMMVRGFSPRHDPCIRTPSAPCWPSRTPLGRG